MERLTPEYLMQLTREGWGVNFANDAGIQLLKDPGLPGCTLLLEVFDHWVTLALVNDEGEHFVHAGMATHFHLPLEAPGEAQGAVERVRWMAPAFVLMAEQILALNQARAGEALTEFVHSAVPPDWLQEEACVDGNGGCYVNAESPLLPSGERVALRLTDEGLVVAYVRATDGTVACTPDTGELLVKNWRCDMACPDAVRQSLARALAYLARFST